MKYTDEQQFYPEVYLSKQVDNLLSIKPAIPDRPKEPKRPIIPKEPSDNSHENFGCGLIIIIGTILFVIFGLQLARNICDKMKMFF